MQNVKRTVAKKANINNIHLGQRDWVSAGLQRKNIDDPIGGFACLLTKSLLNPFRELIKRINKNMEKLTEQQLKGISKLLHHIHDEKVTQYILEVLGKENWSRPVLIESCEFLNEEQETLLESLGGCYSDEEMDEFMDIWDINDEISKKLKEMGVTRYLYENEEYIEDIRKGTIICEGINVEEIKKNLEISKNML